MRRPVGPIVLPEQGGDLLVAGPGGHAGRPLAAVGGPVVPQLRDAGGDRGEAGLHLPAAPGAAGERFDLVEVEQAAFPVLGPLRGEQTSADVGVEGRQLHPQAPRRLLALEQLAHEPSLGRYIDLINIYNPR